MRKILTTYFFFFSALLIISSIVMERDIISMQTVRLKKLVIPEEDQKDHSLVLIIPSYNCSDVTKKTLDSIFSQSYQNFRVVYIDDGSSDLTNTIASEYAKELNDKRLVIKHFSERKGTVERLYEEVQNLSNDEIVIYMKGNAWLDDLDALQKIHHYYKNYDVWFAYTQHINYRTKEVGSESPWCIKNALRRKSFEKPRLKTFYAGLFKRVKLMDFFFEEKFVSDHQGEAYILPLMEMAADHTAFISEPLCAYIQRSIYNEDRPSQQSSKMCLHHVRSQPSYKQLFNHPALTEPQTEALADIVIFSYNRPLQLFALLESIHRYVKSYDHINVIYRASNARYEKAYRDLIKAFPNANFDKQKKEADDFNGLLEDATFNSPSEYVLFSHDDIIIKESFDLKNCIDAMKEASSYFFSLRLGKNISYSYREGFNQNVPYHIQHAEDVIGWQADSTKGSWAKSHSIDMSLYRKKVIEKAFKKIHFKDPFDLEQKWAEYHAKKNHVGLAFSSSKAIGLPLKTKTKDSTSFYTTAELLVEFEKGRKMNIDPIYGINNPSIYMDYQPLFVDRKESSYKNPLIVSDL